jgi:uroporphyrinogen-III decarboxylase
MGGIDESLFVQGSAALAAESRQVMNTMSGRAFVLATGCGLPLNISPEPLRAFRLAVE